jgi:hypothetical protein
MATKAKAKKQSSRTRVTDDDKIVCKENPFTKGSARFEQMEIARKAGSVGKVVAQKGNRDYLSWFARRGLVKVG